MGRRARNEFPQPRFHTVPHGSTRFHKGTGQARVRVNGREIWLGRWGSPEADVRHGELLQARAASGGTAVEPAPERPSRQPQATAVIDQRPQLTVGDLLVQYLLVVKAERPVDRTHSKWWLA